MEPSKANTVGTVKNSPSLCTTRKTLQFFRACSGFFFFFPPTPRRLHVSRGKQTWIGTTNAGLFMNFLLLNVAFVIYLNFFKFKYIK